MQKKYLEMIGLGAVLILVVAGLSVWQAKRPGGLAPTPVVSIEVTPVVENAIVMENNQFRPAVYRVQKGKKVTWKNMDDVAHTVTSDALGGQHIVKQGSELTIDTGKSPLLRGEITYKCDFHPGMSATLAIVSGELSAFGRYLDGLSRAQKNCIEKSLTAGRLLGLVEGYIAVPTQDEQRAIDLCVR